MNQSDPSAEKNRAQKIINLTLAGVVSQVGCLTLVVIMAALIGGLWLDKQFSTKPLFTIIFVLGSVPVTVIMMLWVVRSATARIKPVLDKKPKQEETDRGTTS